MNDQVDLGDVPGVDPEPRAQRTNNTGRNIPPRRGARPMRADPRERPQDRRAQAPADVDPRMEVRAPEERLYRNRPEGGFDFSIDRNIIPAGWSYEWKRKSYLGKADTRHMNSLRMNHWKEVPAERHPELASEDAQGSITVDGMVLMERPLYLTQEARREGLENAVEQRQSVSERLGETPSGTFSRNHQSARNNTYVRRDYEAFDPGMIPE